MERSQARETLCLVVPFVVWALGFVLLYGGHGLACAVGVRAGEYAGITRIALGVLLAVVLTAQGWIVYRYLQRLRAGTGEGRHFVRLASLVLSIAALGASLWTGLPVLFLRICGIKAGFW